jgi:hypothetical protein
MAGLAEMLQVCRAVKQIANADGPISDLFTDRNAVILGLDRQTRSYRTRQATPIEKAAADQAEGDLSNALGTILREGNLTTVQKARLLTRVVPLAREGASEKSAGALTNTLVALAPSDMANEGLEVRAAATSRALLDQSFALHGRCKPEESAADQQATMERAVADGFLPPDAVYIGPCVTDTLDVKVGDEILKCLVVDTECGSPKVSLTNLLAVVNPFNWAENYPAFFNRMDMLPPYIDDEWTRVLETVSLVGVEDLQNITTRLRFHTKEHPKRTSASLDYDLDTSKLREAAVVANNGYNGSAGDGRVKYDRGWINMWVDNPEHDPDQPGVRARTKKIVHIDRVNPELQELVGFLGYGTASAEFLLGSAVKPTGRKAFLDRGPATVRELEADELESTPTQTDGRYFAPTAVSIWRNTVTNLMDDYLDVANQWTAGQLTVDRLATYAADTTDHMIRAPFEFLEAMTKPRRRRSNQPNTTGQGDQS